MSSLVKFMGRAKSSNGEKLFWGRVTQDNLPFRGPSPPIYKDVEFEEKTVRVADVRNAFFDVTDETQNKQYLDVLECCLNGWFKVLYEERFWINPQGQRTTKMYIEWIEYYLEDGSRTPFAVITELSNG